MNNTKIYKRLFNDYSNKHLRSILLAAFFSIVVAGSTSSIAWLLDPAIKKIFIEKDQTLSWLIPICIIIAFSSKGICLYFARVLLIKTGQEISGELQAKVAKYILNTDIATIEKKHSSEITKFEKWAERKLAYTINNNTSGECLTRW